MPESGNKIVHISVLAKEILTLLAPQVQHSILVDATLGEGGHSAVFLQDFPDLVVLAVERDPEILKIARHRLEAFGDRVLFFNTWFTDFFRQYHTLHHTRPHRILFDLGISGFHFKLSGRGFSFRDDEPLDMRLNPQDNPSAEDIINTFAEKELADLFRLYGEERFAGRIARRIAEQRRQSQITTARGLAELISQAVPAASRRRTQIHPATRCFQALRIFVNRELERLQEVLQLAFDVLQPGGRMAVIAYHSLEDRLVKQFFREKYQVCICPPEMPICQCKGKREVQLLTKKPLFPSAEEIHLNRAARSARLRVVEKL